MKKFLSIVLTMTMLVALTAAFPANTSALDIGIKPVEFGSYDISRCNNLWGEPSSNVVLAITPGNALTGMYFNKLYAEFDSKKNCYIVKKKVWNLRDFSDDGKVFVVPEGGVGLLFNYAPRSDVNNTRLREMWMTWQNVKVGDYIYLENIDVAAGTVSSGAKATFKTTGHTYSGNSFYKDKTIVALGDSITVGGGWTEDLEEHLGCRVVNAGIGGDTAADAVASRFDMLVPQHNPDIVIISYGINDCLAARLSKPTLQHIADYKAKMRTLYEKATAIGAKVVFQNANNIKVSTYEASHNVDGRFAEFGGVQGYLDLWEQSLKDLARELDVPFIDLYNMWRQDIPSDDGIGEYLVDNVHPNDKGFDLNMEVIKEAWTNAVPKIFGWNDIKEGSNLVVEEGVIKNVPVGTTAAELVAMFNNAQHVLRDSQKLSDTQEVTTGDTVVFTVDTNNYSTAIETNEYTVTFKATEGGEISGTTSFKANYGSKLSSFTYPTPASKEGYRFARWYAEDNIVSGDMTVVAEFEKIMHTVTFVAGEGGVLIGTTVLPVLDGTSFSTLTFPEAKPRNGYEFVSWEKDATGTKVKSDVTITAVFRKIADSSVTFVAGEGGTLEGTTNVMVADGTAVNSLTFPTAVANEGYEFVEWFYEGDTINGDMTITAVFKKTVKLGDVNADGKISPLDASLVLQYNAKLIKELENVEGADVNGDGSITPLDASLILQFNAKLINAFPAEKK